MDCVNCGNENLTDYPVCGVCAETCHFSHSAICVHCLSPLPQLLAEHPALLAAAEAALKQITSGDCRGNEEASKLHAAIDQARQYAALAA